MKLVLNKMFKKKSQSETQTMSDDYSQFSDEELSSAVMTQVIDIIGHISIFDLTKDKIDTRENQLKNLKNFISTITDKRLQKQYEKWLEHGYWRLQYLRDELHRQEIVEKAKIVPLPKLELDV